MTYLVTWKLARGFLGMEDDECDFFEDTRRQWQDRFILEPENLVGPGRMETNYGSWSKFTCPYSKKELAEWFGYTPLKKVADEGRGHIDKDELKEKLDIFTIIGNYTSLRVRGDRATGLCPLHNERSPSLSVDRRKKVFHCFGCGEGGDVFRFIERAEGCDFRTAVILLNEKV